ncbi:UDP-N-acetylmuramoyl-L-alanine--D-glutamate ligase [Lysobacter sp. A03]|uniref:UDP-N-acetylmuramoyl-L-alanine--D-glutamate ligase n=1 Tax=Lysobacter sp. A03 TaxID=1199154 RepID=UPI0005B6B2A7|nr:UDP-N-acetylmuramoyl-L-alanine--D-glutamate ligase [Lysobacter sp. A03]KIQ97090.1 UDP-N-acetylmuramoylalanine--D-glutamate ligase [Lysobacter sp. A03]
MRISQLDGRRVALWGWGREGQAAWRAIRSRLPTLPLTLFCTPDEVATARSCGDALLNVAGEASAGRLAAFDVVMKSPGISPYAPEAAAAAARGTRFIGGTGLWFAEQGDAAGIAANTVCVTGTKGKSTTTALLAHLLRAAGRRTALAGNIGLPLLELLDVAPAEAPESWVIELSSYQTADVAASGVRPDIAVVLNVFPEHLDWHGSEARYVEDKLQLVTEARPRVAVLNAADPRLAALQLPDSEIRWFGDESGWHLRGEFLFDRDTQVMDTSSLRRRGRTNPGNVWAALRVVDAMDLNPGAVATRANAYLPLPNRLQTLGTRDGLTWVNDSISTTPYASLAALECFAERRVAILLGGHDRGVDWSEFAKALACHAPQVVVTMGANGPRIHQLLAPMADNGEFVLLRGEGLADAVNKARAALDGDGVVLLSPGAPSFGPYRDYVARGRHFASLAGFDPDAISAIPGLGIA